MISFQAHGIWQFPVTSSLFYLPFIYILFELRFKKKGFFVKVNSVRKSVSSFLFIAKKMFGHESQIDHSHYQSSLSPWAIHIEFHMNHCCVYCVSSIISEISYLTWLANCISENMIAIEQAKNQIFMRSCIRWKSIAKWMHFVQIVHRFFFWWIADNNSKIKDSKRNNALLPSFFRNCFIFSFQSFFSDKVFIVNKLKLFQCYGLQLMPNGAPTNEKVGLLQFSKTSAGHRPIRTHLPLVVYKKI